MVVPPLLPDALPAVLLLPVAEAVGPTPAPLFVVDGTTVAVVDDNATSSPVDPGVNESVIDAAVFVSTSGPVPASVVVVIVSTPVPLPMLLIELMFPAGAVGLPGAPIPHPMIVCVVTMTGPCPSGTGVTLGPLPLSGRS